MTHRAPPGQKLIEWLHAKQGQTMFSTQDAREGTGYGAQYVSTALTILAKGGHGVVREQPGVYSYDPEYDTSRVRKYPKDSPKGRTTAVVVERKQADTDLARRVAEYVFTHPNQPLTGAIVGAAVTGLPGSATGALARLAARNSEVRQLVRGVYMYQPDSNGAASEYNSPFQPAVDSAPYLKQAPTAGPMAGKTRSLEPSGGGVRIGYQPTLKPGAPLEVVGTGSTGNVVVKDEAGRLYQLNEL